MKTTWFLCSKFIYLGKLNGKTLLPCAGCYFWAHHKADMLENNSQLLLIQGLQGHEKALNKMKTMKKACFLAGMMRLHKNKSVTLVWLLFSKSYH